MLNPKHKILVSRAPDKVDKIRIDKILEFLSVNGNEFFFLRFRYELDHGRGIVKLLLLLLSKQGQEYAYQFN